MTFFFVEVRNLAGRLFLRGVTKWKFEEQQIEEASAKIMEMVAEGRRYATGKINQTAGWILW